MYDILLSQNAATLKTYAHVIGLHAPRVDPRANQGNCKMGGAKFRISLRGGGI